jgi:hypothetical protein
VHTAKRSAGMLAPSGLPPITSHTHVLVPATPTCATLTSTPSPTPTLQARWGVWRLDRASAVGVADGEEGLALEELSAAVGPARASLRGCLLGSRQDAVLALRDFPLALLAPLTRLLPPALQVCRPRCCPNSWCL